MKIYIRSEATARSAWPAQKSWPARCNARRPRIQNLTVFQPTLRAVKGGSKNWYRTYNQSELKPELRTRKPKVVGAIKTRGVGQI